MAVLGLALAAPAAAQQPLPNVLLKGKYTQSGPGGYAEETTVKCRGVPTCAGTYTSRIRDRECPNHYTVTGTFEINNLDLARSGPLLGTFRKRNRDTLRTAGGLCFPSLRTETEVYSYLGNWNRDTQRGTLAVAPGQPTESFTLAFTADLVAPEPVFPLDVRSEVGPERATVTADVRFRNEDVGRTGSVFVFASAPAPRVRNGLAESAVKLGMSSKADTPCVLAQANPAGQLVAVTSGQMQALVTGTLSAAGAAVTILNNTPVAEMPGATFYVGYGTSGASMIANGVFQNAALVPGDATCPPIPYATSLWWNPSESGWGLNLSQQGGLLFATLFTYDNTRAPMWLVMSGGALQADGVTFTGPLYRTTGPAFNANPFTPIGAANVTQVGTMSVELDAANAATLTYTVNGVEVQKNIQRQVYGSRSAVCLPTADPRTGSANYQDLWWNAAESGWGINVTHQDNTLFATLFTYDPSGRDLWLVMSQGVRQADGSYLGDLYRTTGSPFSTQPFPPIGAADVTLAGNMRLRFTNGDTGMLTYTYNGATVTKSIVRQVFSSPVPACN
jgi:hypothetical protein